MRFWVLTITGVLAALLYHTSRKDRSDQENEVLREVLNTSLFRFESVLDQLVFGDGRHCELQKPYRH